MYSCGAVLSQSPSPLFVVKLCGFSLKTPFFSKRFVRQKEAGQLVHSIAKIALYDNKGDFHVRTSVYPKCLLAFVVCFKLVVET